MGIRMGMPNVCTCTRKYKMENFLFVPNICQGPKQLHLRWQFSVSFHFAGEIMKHFLLRHCSINTLVGTLTQIRRVKNKKMPKNTDPSLVKTLSSYKILKNTLTRKHSEKWTKGIRCKWP